MGNARSKNVNAPCLIPYAHFKNNCSTKVGKLYIWIRGYLYSFYIYTCITDIVSFPFSSWNQLSMSKFYIGQTSAEVWGNIYHCLSLEGKLLTLTSDWSYLVGYVHSQFNARIFNILSVFFPEIYILYKCLHKYE